MLKNFTAQNFNGDLYRALDFQESSAFLFIAKDGDISVLKRFIQLLWASTTEDGISIKLSLNSIDHNLNSTEDNTYFDEEVVRIGQVENIYGLKFADYSKNFVITYTQLLNLELGRIPSVRYLNQYVFFKPDSKSYYSPLEDIFYDIEQAKKYNSEIDSEESENEANTIDRIQEVRAEILELENSDGTVVDTSNSNEQKIKELQDELEVQKSQDEMLSQKEDLIRGLDMLSKKVRNYEESLSKVSKMDIDINKHNNFLRLNPEKTEKDLSMFAYRIREREKVLSELVHKNVNYYEAHTNIALLPIIVLLVLSLGIGLTLSVLANVFFGAVICLIFCSCIILYFVFAKETPKSKNPQLDQKNIQVLHHEIDTLKLAKSRYIQNLGFNNEDDYYATKALMRGLLFEKEKDLATLHEKFDGKEISDLKVEYETKRNQALDLQMQIDKLGPVMSPEEYIKKRRELDILKLDSNSSNASNMNDSGLGKQEKIEILKKELDSLEKQSENISNPVETYLNILREYYDNTEINSDDKYILENLEPKNYDEKVELFIIERIAYLKSVYPNIELPLILEDPFVGVENYDIIKKIINFCSKHFQLILTSEHEKYKELGLKVINIEE